ncbi:hypothetical protein ACVWXO_008253 [Bradyrhizobium sp. LM2.7]
MTRHFPPKVETVPHANRFAVPDIFEPAPIGIPSAKLPESADTAY